MVRWSEQDEYTQSNEINIQITRSLFAEDFQPLIYIVFQ